MLFLASLGAGGIAVLPFSFLNYTFPHGKGLIEIGQMPYGQLAIWQEVLFRSLEGVMILFIALHIILSLLFAAQLFRWMSGIDYKSFMADPLKNAGILSPFISLVMTMNVMVGPLRYFIPQMAHNLQSLMMPALVFWLLVGFFLMRMEIKLLKISFEKSFDVNKIHFGWLLHPFALGMYTVTGTGIAALSTNGPIAHTAAFVSFVFGSMGLFLLIVKMVAIFKSHFAQSGLPERQFLPSFLIVIPNITLYAISLFRIGHYFENHFDAHLHLYFIAVVTIAFAFETWYMLFGLSLLLDYFRNHFSKEYYPSQWGLVCPVVAYAVLGEFVYNLFVQSEALYILIIITLIVSVVLFFSLLLKHMKCAGMAGGHHVDCE